MFDFKKIKAKKIPEKAFSESSSDISVGDYPFFMTFNSGYIVGYNYQCKNRENHVSTIKYFNLQCLEALFLVCLIEKEYLIENHLKVNYCDSLPKWVEGNVCNVWENRLSNIPLENSFVAKSTGNTVATNLICMLSKNRCISNGVNYYTPAFVQHLKPDDKVEEYIEFNISQYESGDSYAIKSVFDNLCKLYSLDRTYIEKNLSELFKKLQFDVFKAEDVLSYISNNDFQSFKMLVEDHLEYNAYPSNGGQNLTKIFKYKFEYKYSSYLIMLDQRLSHYGVDIINALNSVIGHVILVPRSKIFKRENLVSCLTETSILENNSSFVLYNSNEDDTLSGNKTVYVCSSFYLMFDSEETIMKFKENLNMKKYAYIFDTRSFSSISSEVLDKKMFNYKTTGNIQQNVLRTAYKRNITPNKRRIDISVRKSKFLGKYNGFIQPYTTVIHFNDRSQEENARKNIDNILDHVVDSFIESNKKTVELVEKYSSDNTIIIGLANDCIYSRTSLTNKTYNPTIEEEIYKDTNIFIGHNIGIMQKDQWTPSQQFNLYPEKTEFRASNFNSDEFRQQLIHALYSRLIKMHEQNGQSIFLSLREDLIKLSLFIPLGDDTSYVTKILNFSRLFNGGVDSILISNSLYSDEDIVNITNILEKF